MRSTVVFAGAICLLVVVALRPQRVEAQEYLRDQTVAPKAADEMLNSSVDVAQPGRARRPIRRLLERQGPLWRDSEFDFDLRGYDFSREDDATTLSEAFAVGGELSFRSGRYKERLSFGGSWYTSHPVDAPSDKDGTGLLGPGQSGLSVLGRAYVQVNQGELIARLYRQDLDLPYLNRNDSRMIPNTFEAYILARRSTTEELGFIIGHVEKMKSRNSKNFVSMAQMAGAMGSDAGTSVAGLRWSPSTRFELSALTLMTQDVFNTAHLEASWRKEMSLDWAVNLAAQYSDQQSTGRDLAGNFSTDTKGLRAAISYRNGVLTLAHTATDRGGAVRSPFGGRPGFNSMMLFDFDRAGERASQIGVSYHFGRIGWPALSIQINRASGKDAIDSSSRGALADEEETDITLDYQPESGPLQGLWIRYRVANGDRGSPSANRRDRRLIVNYELPLF